MLPPVGRTDASGNAKLSDIGPWLKERIADSFAEAGMETTVRYVDPSYIIRSVPANPYDSVYTVRLSQAACTPPCPGAPRWSSGGCDAGSCTSR